jgi:CRISPR-associated exonuclease Cas4
MNKIPISWLNTQAYCEYQIYLEHVAGVKAEKTLEMVKGSAIHSRLEAEHIGKAELEITVEKALEKSAEEKVVLVSRELRVMGTRLIGVIDEIHIAPDRIRILDDKPGDRVFPSSVKQIWGYCLAFIEHYKPDLPLVGVLRNRDSGLEIWEEQFSEEARLDVTGSVLRIEGILGGTTAAIPTRNSNKCTRCRFSPQCGVKAI